MRQLDCIPSTQEKDLLVRSGRLTEWHYICHVVSPLSGATNNPATFTAFWTSCI